MAGMLEILTSMMASLQGPKDDHKTVAEKRGWMALVDTSAGVNKSLAPEAAKAEMDRDVYAKTAKAEDATAPLEVMQTIKERMKGKTLPEEVVFDSYHSWRKPPKWEAPGDLKQLEDVKKDADAFLGGTAQADLPPGVKYFHKVGTHAPRWADMAKAVQRGKHWFY